MGAAAQRFPRIIPLKSRLLFRSFRSVKRCCPLLESSLTNLRRTASWVSKISVDDLLPTSSQCHQGFAAAYVVDPGSSRQQVLCGRPYSGVDLHWAMTPCWYGSSLITLGGREGARLMVRFLGCLSQTRLQSTRLTIKVLWSEKWCCLPSLQTLQDR